MAAKGSVAKGSVAKACRLGRPLCVLKVEFDLQNA